MKNIHNRDRYSSRNNNKHPIYEKSFKISQPPCTDAPCDRTLHTTQRNGLASHVVPGLLSVLVLDFSTSRSRSRWPSVGVEPPSWAHAFHCATAEKSHRQLSKYTVIRTVEVVDKVLTCGCLVVYVQVFCLVSFFHFGSFVCE